MAHRSSLLAAVALAVATGCPTTTKTASYPPPQVYGEATDFSGKWRGEVGDVSGVLRIEELGDGRYYANFSGENRPVKYILSLDQIPGRIPDDGTAPSNLCLFTWQDGRGGRGEGWLLINRDHTALTGTFGRGGGNTGMGVWTFRRDGDGAAESG